MNAIILGKRGIPANSALRAPRYFGTSAEVWMNLRRDYDLEMRRDALAGKLDKEVRRLRKVS